MRLDRVLHTWRALILIAVGDVTSEGMIPVLFACSSVLLIKQYIVKYVTLSKAQ